MIVLAEGYTLADVADAVADDGVEIDSSLSTESAFRQATPTMRSIATALRLFALVAGLAGLIAIGQAAARACRTPREATTRPSGRWAPPGPSGGLAWRRRARWPCVGGTVLGTGPRRGGVPALPDRAGPPRRPRSRVPRRLQHRGARWRGVDRPAGHARRGRRPLACPPTDQGDLRRAGSAAGARSRRTSARPAPAVTGLTPGLGHAGPSRPHRRRRHHAQRDGRAGGLRVQRERRPPARPNPICTAGASTR